MDYSYLPERQENRSAPPESSRGHPQNQYPVHCEHQQYPTGHQVLPAGYPGLGFSPYLQSLQGLGTAAGPGLGSQEGVLSSRMLVQDLSDSGSRGPSERRHDLENVHSGAMSVPTTMHFRPDGASSHHSTHLEQVLPIPPPLPQTSLPTPEAGFHTERMTGVQMQGVAPKGPLGHLQNVAPKNMASRAVIGRANSISQSIHHSKRKLAAFATTDSSSSSQGIPSVSHSVDQLSDTSDPASRDNELPAKQPAQEPPEEPARQQRSPPQVSTKGCQTDPLFRDVARAEEETRASSPDLPDGLGYVEMIGQKKKHRGIMATKDFEAGEEFGPFTGEFVKEGIGSVNPSTWEICVRGKTRFYISGASDPNNWMTLVQVARCKEEQNLEAFQFYGDIFFRTTKAVESGAELRVFYSRDYRKRVGFMGDLDDLKLDQGTKRFECKDCKCHYTNAKSLLRHVKFEHDKENQPTLSKKEGAQVCNSTTVLRELDLEKKGERIPNRNTARLKIKIDKEKKHHKHTLSKKSKPNNSSKQLQVKFVSQKKTKEGSSVKRKSDIMHRFVCDICQKAFPSEGHLGAHMAFHVEVKVSKHVCSTCGLECKNTRVLKQHVISHDPDAYRCHICRKYFRRKSRIVAHLRYDHSLFVGKKWGRADLDDLLIKRQDPSDDDAGSDGEGKREEGEGNVRGVKSKPTCGKCAQEFDSVEDLEKHSSAHGSNDFKCRYCSKSFQRNSELVAHFRQDHKIFLWKKHSLKKNRDERLARLILPDEQTEESSQFHPELPQDMLGKRIVQELKMPKFFKCKYCPKTYTNFGRVIRHEKQVHTNTGEYMCEFCSAMFVRETDYILHKRKHTKEQPFKCAECPQSFACESALEKHMAEHRGECPFKCDVCGKGYRTRKYMQSHRRKIHQAPKELYPCSFCGRQFRDKGGRKKHENCHRGIRPYVCLTCGKAFGNANTLKCHTRIHTGEKPFQCKQCDKRFRLPHQLNIHMVIHDKARNRQKANQQDGRTGSPTSGGSTQPSTVITQAAPPTQHSLGHPR